MAFNVGRPAKRAKLLDDSEQSDSDSGHSSALGEAANGDLAVNREYAARFEHNKKREELQRLQEKYGKDYGLGGRRNGNVEDTESESESDEEEEDEDGYLASGRLDEEVLATLHAIRTKDPRVYDKNTIFYETREHKQDESPADESENAGKQKPVFLRDYHRQNLLGQIPESSDVPPSYEQEQAAIKKQLMDQMRNGTANDDEESNGSEDEEDGEFLKRKPRTKSDKPQEAKLSEQDIQQADEDPEKFLSKFLSTRGWVPTTSSKFQPFDSDEEEDIDRADEFEQAYNLRFDDPAKANEKLVSHSRETAAKHSVRREERKGRKKQRDALSEARQHRKLEEEDDRARLRRLKVEEAQEKLEKFKEVAGLKDKDMSVKEWSRFLKSDFDDEKWETEMMKSFGENYYGAGDDEIDEDGGESEGDSEPGKDKRKKTKLKKPVWDDDIHIDDIVPEFDEEEERRQRTFALSDGEDEQDEDIEDGGVPLNGNGDIGKVHTTASLSKKEAEKIRSEKKRRARKERQQIEEIVDQNMLLDQVPSVVTSSRKANRGSGSNEPRALFRYRETSPTTYGLSAREILMAEDSQLNQFIGLKKLASFRDAEKKRKDKKYLGKKARLRQWRKDTFGDENGPKRTFEEFVRGQVEGNDGGPDIDGSNRTKKKKKMVKYNLANGESSTPTEAGDKKGVGKEIQGTTEKGKKKRSRRKRAEAVDSNDGE